MRSVATVMEKGLPQGIYLRPLGNTVYIMPPYCISPEQLRKIYQFILSLELPGVIDQEKLTRN